MNLAPYEIGNGDSDLFTQAAGGNHHTQTVGKFALGSRRLEHRPPRIEQEL